MTHWAERYIGIPWVNGATGPDEFDCWGFVRHVQRERFGRELPPIKVDADSIRDVARAFGSHDERASWMQVERPIEGDCVLMAHAKYPSHVGLWVEVDGGGVLHCIRGPGVVFNSLSALRHFGWGRIDIYRRGA
jgi:cell wall-associated NlpC family hydrolase